MAEKETLQILKDRGMTREEAEAAIAGIKKALKENVYIPPEQVFKNLKIPESTIPDFLSQWIKPAPVCVFYYSTVVDAGAGKWFKVGEHILEIEGVWNGKDPVFCCANLKEAYEVGCFHFIASMEGEVLALQVSLGNRRPTKFYFCFFCGAKITFEENLKLKVEETTVEQKTYCFEEVK